MISLDRKYVYEKLSKVLSEKAAEAIAGLFKPRMSILCNGNKEFMDRYKAAFEKLHKDDVFVPLNVKKFDDSEFFVKIEENVRRKRAYVVHNFIRYGTDSEFDPNESLVELLIINDALRRASVDEITNILPYIPYLRQDRKDEGRVPITAKLLFNILTASGANRVVTFDLHAEQEQGFSDYPVDNLTALPLLGKVFFGEENRYEIDPKDCTVVAPDVGSAKMIERFKRLCDREYRTDLRIAILGKRNVYGQNDNTMTRDSDVNFVIGDIKPTVLMLDDQINTAGSVCTGSEVLRGKGAKRVIVGATHGVFAPKEKSGLPEAAEDKLEHYGIETIVTDTIPRCSDYFKKYTHIGMVSTASMLAEVTHRIDYGGSVSELFAHWD